MSITGLQIATKFVTEGVAETEKSIKGIQQSADDASGSESGGGVKGLLGNILGMVGGVAVFAGVGAGIGAVTGFLQDSVGVAQQAQQSQQLLANAIKDTNDASGQSVAGLDDYAEHLSTVTDYSKDTVEGVEQIALRAKIPKGLFDETTQEALDMAQAMGISAPNAANILTKALDDPKTAAAQLRREHINLTDAQQKAIAMDVKHGDSLKAQSVILDAVKGSYGGAAEAAGNTFAGKLGILQNQLENTKEKIGDAVLPILSRLMGAVMPLVTQFADKLPGALATATDFFNKNLLPALNDVANIITSPVIPAIDTIAGKIGDFITYLQTHQDVMDAFKAALAGFAIVIVAGLIPAFIGWASVAAAAALETIIATAPIILIGLAVGALILGIIELVRHWSQITAMLGKFKDGVAKDVGDAFSGLGTAVHTVWTGIQNAVKGGINTVIGDVNSFIRALDSIQIHIPSVGVGPVKTPGLDWNGLGLGQIPYLAAGGTAVTEGLSVVGEHGPELQYLPKGASIIPLGMGGGAGANAGNAAGATGATITLVIDGRQIARAVLPHLTDAVYNATGVRGV